MSNYIPYKTKNVITHPYPNLGYRQTLVKVAQNLNI